MGNCSHKAVIGNCPYSVRIMTDSGSILEFEGPKLVQEILQDFPGHGIFQKGNLTSLLSDQELLLSGQFYYLLPLWRSQIPCSEKANEEFEDPKGLNNEDSTSTTPMVEAERISTSDFVENAANKSSSLEVLPSLGNGVWRVKLVISREELEQIFSEQVNMEALIEKMRMVALTRKRSSKGYWGANWNWKPTLSSLFKVSSID